MKFIVSSTVLLKNLMTISGVVATNPIVPILENFLFRFDGNLLTVTASDLQTTMTTQVPIDSADSSSIAIPAKLLTDTLKSLPEQPITVKISDTFGIEILTDNGRFKIAGENPVDFPKIPTVTKTNAVDLSSDTLLAAIRQTVLATSTDDLRPAMTGVLVQFAGVSATFAATDGHRLVRYRRTGIVSTADQSVILPRKALSLLKTSLPTGIEVQVELSQANACFTYGSTQLICRLIDERFPDYANAIPTGNNNVMTIGRVDLHNSLKRVMIYANRTTHQIRLTLKANSLSISAEDLDYSNDASEKLMCEYDGDDMEIGFNGKFLAEMLANQSARIIGLHMSQPNRAGIIIPTEQEEGEDTLVLVMPVMLNTYA